MDKLKWTFSNKLFEILFFSEFLVFLLFFNFEIEFDFDFFFLDLDLQDFWYRIFMIDITGAVFSWLSFGFLILIQ